MSLPPERAAGVGVDQVQPVDVKAHLPAADSIVDALPWVVGRTPAQQRRSRGRASALAHQITALLDGGWTLDEAWGSRSYGEPQSSCSLVEALAPLGTGGWQAGPV